MEVEHRRERMGVIGFLFFSFISKVAAYSAFISSLVSIEVGKLTLSIEYLLMN